MIRTTLAAALLLGGCATGAERAAQAEERTARDAADLAAALEGFAPGDTRTCLDTTGRSFATDPVGTKILYRESRSRIWVTETGGGCNTGAGDPILVTVQTSGQLCRGDIIRALDRASRFVTGSCSAGEFTLYTRAGDAS